MAQPPSLVWGQNNKTTGTPVNPLDSQSQQALAQVSTGGMSEAKPWSTLQSNMCLTRNDPCTPAAPTPPGSYS